MEGLLNNPEILVIAVVGMGGLGKTFLLQFVFNALKSRYHHSIWLSISKSYSVKSLQRDIASHIGLKSEIVGDDVSEERAAVLIHGYLQGKRCLIVLDDLWTLSTEDSLLDKLGVPADKDCKVLVSSRNREVAVNLKAHIYELEALSEKDSWELFCFYAFPDCKENRAPSKTLKEVGHEIVKQCGNLPLAIKTTAASLAKTKSLSKWESKRRQLEKTVIPFGEDDPVMEILRLSYDSLPAHLKPCFAYLSFFPEDERITCEYLIYLWIGEGFVPSGEEQWDMAWNWLDQLAQLCLLQLCEDRAGYFFNGNVTKYCAIHDLLHDLAINISREKNCVFSLEEASMHAGGKTSGCCRILLAKKDINDNAFSQRQIPSHLRTLSLSQNMEMRNIPENLFTAMRGLRVLDLSLTVISTLPESVGKMILLRVLNLKYTRIRNVPECVRYLKSLLFLALPTVCSELPEWITGLRYLQHLDCWRVESMPKGTSKLVSLRTLRTNWVHLESIEEDLACMTQLQEISLSVTREREVKRIEEGLLAHLVKMRRLVVKNNIGDSRVKQLLLPLPETIREMKHLERLALWKFGVPSWICDLENLRELELYECHCNNYPELDGMPNLVNLVLDKNDWCRKLPEAFGKSGAFPRLRFFEIFDFKNLKFPKLEEGAMPCLEELGLYYCYCINFPALECLKSLKKFTYPRKGLDEDILKEGGEYRNKIKAVNPHLTIIEV